MTGYKKWINKETISYIITGICTTVLNIVLFRILRCGAELNYRTANVITLITVKLMAYLCMKFIVFHRKCENITSLLKEMVRYIFSRGATALIDFFGLIAWVDVLHWNDFTGKCVITVIVVVLNYVFGKLYVFSAGRTPTPQSKTP